MLKACLRYVPYFIEHTQWRALSQVLPALGRSKCAPRRLRHIAMNRASMLFWRKLIAASIHSLCDNKDVCQSGIAVSWIETLLAVMA
jgi:hypothetical protein